jgi:hypothetical protein
MPRIVVATPCYAGQLTMEYVNSALALQRACFERGIAITFDLRANEALITRARNDLVGRFLRTNGTHLMFIDADIGFTPAQFFRLLDFDVDMAAAAYPLKRIDWGRARQAVEDNRPDLEGAALEYVVYFDGEGRTVTARNDFIRVRYAGTGFLLIRRAVIERLYAAHPELRYKLIERSPDIARADIAEQVSLFECIIDPDTKEYLSEDYAFCRRWLALGGEIWLDIKSRLNHVGYNVFHGSLEAQFKRLG